MVGGFFLDEEPNMGLLKCLKRDEMIFLNQTFKKLVKQFVRYLISKFSIFPNFEITL